MQTYAEIIFSAPVSVVSVFVRILVLCTSKCSDFPPSREARERGPMQTERGNFVEKITSSASVRVMSAIVRICALRTRAMIWRGQENNIMDTDFRKCDKIAVFPIAPF